MALASIDQFCSACVQNDRFLLDLFLTHGFNINSRDDDGRSGLHHAVLGGQLEMVKHLIVHHADVQALDPDGSTPLEIARRAVDCSDEGKMDALFTEHPFWAIPEALVVGGADPNRTSPTGQTLMRRVLAQNPHVDVLRWMIKHGARPTADSIAAAVVTTNFNRPMLIELLNQRADPNGYDADKRLPLTRATALIGRRAP